jgi:RES domain-containing protein
MRLWRIYDPNAPWSREPAFDPLDGSGGLYVASRWNQKGIPMVYLAGTSSLAMLETAVHIGIEDFGEQRLIEVELAAPTLETLGLPSFLQFLRDATDPEQQSLTRAFGSRWAKEQRSVLLQVPSIVNPFESNYLYNPKHPKARATVVQQELVRLDSRLYL